MNRIDNGDFDLDERRGPKRSLPNATAVLVLGIISIVICLVGFITGTIALVLASRDLKEYRANPHLYDESSFKNLNAGRICAIIGVSLSAIAIVFYVLYFIFIFGIINKSIDLNQNRMRHDMEQLQDLSDEEEYESIDYHEEAENN